MSDDITQWLEGLGLGQYAQAFADSDIKFEILPRLTEDDFKDLGLSIGHRRILQAAIEALSADDEPIKPTLTLTPQLRPQPRPAEAERRQLTVLFCDLARGSPTGLACLPPRLFSE